MGREEKAIKINISKRSKNQERAINSEKRGLCEIEELVK